MNKNISGLFIVSFFVLFVFVFCACGYSEKEQAYTLSNQEKQLVNTIYNSRGVWEKHNGDSCTNIRYVEKNGNKFLLCSYRINSSGIDFMGETVYSSMEVKYIITNSGMRQANANEYGSNDYGLVTGMFSYNTSGSSDAKKASIAKAVTNKSHVVIP